MRRMPGFSRPSTRSTNASIDRALISTAANQRMILTSASMQQPVCPLPCIGTRPQLSTWRNRMAGILRYSRGHLEITNAEGLRETSCECYQTVKARHDRLLKAPD
jgi:hypothetical protein